MHDGDFMPSCYCTRQRWKLWTSLLMRSTWFHLEVRTMAGKAAQRRGRQASFPLSRNTRFSLDRMLKCTQLLTLDELSACRVVVWNVESKQAICGSPASGRSSCPCLAVQFCNTSSNLFVTAARWGKPVFGIFHRFIMSQPLVFFVCSSALQVWELDPLNRKIKPTECQAGILKRVVKCIEVRRGEE